MIPKEISYSGYSRIILKGFFSIVLIGLGSAHDVTYENCLYNKPYWDKGSIYKIPNPNYELEVEHSRTIARQQCEKYAEHQYKKITPTMYRGQLVDKYCHALDGGEAPPSVHEVSKLLYPHMVRIGYGENWVAIGWICSGSLISDRFILSSASCINTTSWGAPRWAMLNDLQGRHQFIEIIKTYPHPGYSYNVSAYENDIAILQLKTAVKLSVYARPACILPPPADTNGTKFYATSFMRRMYCLVRTMSEVNNDYCYKFYYTRDEFRKKYNFDEWLCTKNPNDGELNPCSVGQGGALQMHVDEPELNCMFNVIGVMSLAHKCLSDEETAIYIKVDSYIHWIQSIVWPTE